MTQSSYFLHNIFKKDPFSNYLRRQVWKHGKWNISVHLC